ncbi:MAG: hypothetical protein HY046_09675 [Acidobacteria bacterium]|nr:hypothetical protein [Acidobacteriota bacterium]
MTRAGTAAGEELRALLHDSNSEVLAALLENPAIDEPHLQILLERKDLPADILTTISRSKGWMRSYQIKLRVARHPHTPRLAAMPLLKQLYLFDLVNVSLTPGVPGEMRRIADDLIIARLPQIPVGQKFTLARRGSARVAAAILQEGNRGAIPLSLDNSFLTEAQVLKVLSKTELSEDVVDAVSRHGKWAFLYNVRLALVRHPLTPLSRVLTFLPDLTLRDLKDLQDAKTMPDQIRRYIRGEIESRAARRISAKLRA